MKRILAAAAVLTGLASAASAATIDFTFKNSTSSPVEEFYLSLPTTDDWEENLVTSPVQPGQKVISSITDTGSCLYDVKTVFADGESTEDRGWDFCADPDYEIEEE
jgi:hypothetical protein